MGGRARLKSQTEIYKPLEKTRKLNNDMVRVGERFGEQTALTLTAARGKYLHKSV